MEEASDATSAVMVMGLGSPHGDDQVGWCVIDNLEQDGVVVAALRKVKDPVDILEDLAGVERLFVVDACKSGGQPGSITRLDGARSQHFPTLQPIHAPHFIG